MSTVELLRDLDAQRRHAMLAADSAALGRLLADDLTWTHSSGATESKADFIDAIAEQRVAYHKLEISQDQVRNLGTGFLHQGVLQGSASRDGQTKPLCAKFLALWRETEDAELPMQLIAWQSTNYSLPTG